MTALITCSEVGLPDSILPVFPGDHYSQLKIEGLIKLSGLKKYNGKEYGKEYSGLRFLDPYFSHIYLT